MANRDATFDVMKGIAILAKEYIRKNTRQLVLPYIVTSLVLILLSGIREFINGKGTTLTTIIAALVGNGTINNPTFSEYSIGAIWFLLAMFWCRSIYNILYNRLSEPVFGWTLVSAAVIATYLGTIVFVPTDLFEGI